MKLGLCIVGCGNFAKTFARAIKPLSAEIDLYFASRNIIKAQTYLQKFNAVDAFGSYEQAAMDRRIHAMYISTPHYLHLDHSLMAISAGKHVLVEKPITSEVSQARQLIKAGRDSNIKLMVAENSRFMPSVQRCKNIIEQGLIGTIRVIQIQEESPYQPTGWRTDPYKNGGGVFIDAGIHKIHILRFLMGDPEHIFAVVPQQDSTNKNSEDSLMLMYKTKNDEVGLIYHSSSSSCIQPHNSATITGSKGKIHFELDKPTLRLENNCGVKLFDMPDPLDGLLPMAREFITSIKEDRPPSITGEDGLKDLQLVEMAYKSVESKTSLQLDENSINQQHF